jgi:nucleoid-associated protein YgaU
MPHHRYSNRRIFVNDEKLYDEFFDKKNKKSFVQYSTPVYREVTQNELDQVAYRVHIWKSADRFYKLAAEYYGNPRYWWVIAFFNKKPTEGHINNGDTILIPVDFDQVMMLYGL